jgi:hypothetical protein
MYNPIKSRIRHSFFAYNAYLFLRYRWLWIDWLLDGKPVPPPHLVKQKCVRQYGRRFNLSVLVETGTYRGEMVRALRSAFREIYTIELGQTLYAEAQRVFAPFPHIHVLQGDSTQVLRDVLSRIEEPCLFWLDAHYSGKGTALADCETPVWGELDCILGHAVKSHVILIDDARCFDGNNGYPSLAEIKTCVNERRPDQICEVRDDIIRIHPPAAQ